MKVKFHFNLSAHDLSSGQGLQRFELLHPDSLSKPALRAACGMVDIRLPLLKVGSPFPFLVPEVRQFLQALHRQWPYGAYFIQTTSLFLRTHMLSQLHQVEACYHSDWTNLRIQVQPTEWANLVAQNCACMATVLLANDTTANRLGPTLDQLIGRNMNDFLPPDVAERRRAFVAQVLATGKPVNFEDERLGRWIVNQLNPVLDAHGQPQASFTRCQCLFSGQTRA